ncbi:terminase large subunit [Aureimonas sp. Leaf324]|uniref:terminase large subunit n=1 Tax=Aureimonas sp. Leaf324 TaxID=1736336 RepID=UPI000AD62445|nr:terminase large subunit [Aureimonas sp. Leaf324]
MTPSWSTACPDWEDRIVERRTLVPDLPLFADEAEKALRIFNRLRLPDVIGQPTMAEAGTEWLHPIVSALFGSYDERSHRRMVQELFLLVPKKNSKSSGAAAIMVVALIMNRRPEAEFLLIAPTKQIADIAFKQAWGIIRADRSLSELFHPQEHLRKITHHTSRASLQIKAADTDVITGSKSTGILIDETHVFAKKSNAADIFVEIRGSLAARPDGFLIQVTTQSKEPPQGVFKAELSKARRVRDGQIRLPLLPVLYELPARLIDSDGWKDPATWGLVNPNLGRSVDEQFLANQLLVAEDEGREALALLASQHFNVEIGLRLRSDRWAGADVWEERGIDLNLEALLERSEVVTVGIDGGGLDDLFGLSVIGREPIEVEEEVEVDGIKTVQRTKRWLGWSKAWCHRGVLQRRKSIETKLLDFEKAGDLVIVGDELADVTGIVAVVERVMAAGKLAAVAVDPAGLGELADALDGIGITAENKMLIGAPQGFGMMNAIKTAERKLTNGTFHHAKSGLMDWCVGNLKIEPTATAIRATKQNAGDAKIDPVMAMFDAVFMMATNPKVSTFNAAEWIASYG